MQSHPEASASNTDVSSVPTSPVTHSTGTGTAQKKKCFFFSKRSKEAAPSTATTTPKQVRFCPLLTGNTLKLHEEVVRHLNGQRRGLTQVDSPDKCDIILAFCPIVSRVGTDVEAAVRMIPDNKPAILVVMHFTFDPDHMAPDSSRFGKGKNMFIVDCLFHESQGLLSCQKNSEACDKILRNLNEQFPYETSKLKTSKCATFQMQKDYATTHTEMQSHPEASASNTDVSSVATSPVTHSTGTSAVHHSAQSRPSNRPAQKKKCFLFSKRSKEAAPSTATTTTKQVRFYPLLTGNTLKLHEEVVRHLNGQRRSLTQVDSPDKCDIILAFCPIVSRVGTDVEAAVRMIPDSKPAILVVMHFTFDPDHVAPDSSRFGKGKNMFIVDCLFHDSQGLLSCQKNSDACDKILRNLNKQFPPASK